MLTSHNKNGPVILVSPAMSYVFPLAYGYLAGYLVEHGENVKILLRPKDPFKYRDFIKEIIDLKPLVIGFGSLYPDLYPTKELIHLLNEAGRNFPIVIGGQMVSPTPEFSVEVTGADIGVVGEGEITLYNLVRALRKGDTLFDVKGLALNNGTEKILTGPGEYIEDLSKLPEIPYDLFPSKDWLFVGRFFTRYPQPHNQYADRTVTIHGGRGCPFRCNFCYHHSRPRCRPVDDMIREADELIKKFNANMLFFDDDLAIISPERAREFIKGIKGLHKKVEWSVSIRMDILTRMDDALLREMKESGCRVVGPGIESGSQRILDIMNKKITVDQVITGMRRLRNAGLLVTTSMMVGQLTETPEDVQRSIDVMTQTMRYDKNINYAFSICTPFPGSELYDVCFQRGIFKSHYDFFNKYDPKKGFSCITANLTAMTDEKLLECLQRIRQAFKDEKKNAVGPMVFKIETLIIRADRFNERLNKKIFNKLPNNMIGNGIKIVYKFFYDSMQIFFDKLRLYFLGVRKFKI